jgi:hypothetical protein
VSRQNGDAERSPGRGTREDALVTVLVVDAANVVGSRPDGWWRDRAGAAARLLGRLATMPGAPVTGPDGGSVSFPEVVAVVEGKARDVPAPDGVRVVRAPGSGDDALVDVAVELVGRPVLVVTADRGLRNRLPAGTAVAGPGWLLVELDRIDCAPPA